MDIGMTNVDESNDSMFQQEKAFRVEVELQVDGEHFQDVFICGQCTTPFSDVKEFLLHKATHATTIGELQKYQCDLCKLHFSRMSVLIKHYKSRHQINVIGNGEGIEMKPALKLDDANQFATEPKEDVNIPIDSLIRKESSAVPSTRNLSELDLDDSSLQQHLAIPVTEQLPLHDESATVLMSGNSSHLSGDVEVNEIYLEIESVPGGKTTSNTNKSCPPDYNQIKPEIDFFFVLSMVTIEEGAFEYASGTFRCVYCAFKSSQQMALVGHVHKHHGDKLGTEDIPANLQVNAEDTLMRISTYRNEYRQEGTKRASVGRPAVKKSSSSKSRQRNVEHQDVPGTYYCVKCNKVFSRLRYLRRHRVVHDDEKVYTCEVCGKQFKTKSYLHAHQKSHTEKRFQCDQCDFVSTNNTLIHAHRQLHSNGSVLCDICGFAYSDKSSLAKHKQVHDPKRPFMCTFEGCTWRFKSDTMLKAHVRAHTTSGKFKCCLCGYSFRHKHHLQRHELKTHGIQRVKAVYDHESYKSDADDLGLLVTDGDGETMQYLPPQLVLAAADEQGTSISVEASDLTTLNIAYQTLFQQTSDVQIDGDTQTLGLSVITDSIQ
ncbi:uncharacterized protein LOC141901588 [Tubulanus polymorphus]|uniref:uncharacterized protein LOC141901588 n=1 Tax=Tubulanus polymorphus TaxID=672921 RepID=UPI003DA5F206